MSIRVFASSCSAGVRVSSVGEDGLGVRREAGGDGGWDGGGRGRGDGGGRRSRLSSSLSCPSLSVPALLLFPPQTPDAQRSCRVHGADSSHRHSQGIRSAHEPRDGRCCRELREWVYSVSLEWRWLTIDGDMPDRELGLVVLRGPNVVLISPTDGLAGESRCGNVGGCGGRRRKAKGGGGRNGEIGGRGEGWRRKGQEGEAGNERGRMDVGVGWWMGDRKDGSRGERMERLAGREDGARRMEWETGA